MKTSEYLRKSKDTIRQHGWVKGWMGFEGSGFCVVGAMVEHSAGPDQQSLRRALEAFSVAVFGNSPIIRETIPKWNDHPDRRLQEVYEAFDQAIAQAQAKEAIAEVEAWVNADPPPVEIKELVEA